VRVEMEWRSGDQIGCPWTFGALMKKQKKKKKFLTCEKKKLSFIICR
jgi:hypothetical protein